MHALFSDEKKIGQHTVSELLSSNRLSDYLWIMPIAVILVIWELVTQVGLVPYSALPPFSGVLVALLISLRNPGFIIGIANSFVSLVVGLVLAFSIALPLAFFAGRRRCFDLTFTPNVMLLGALPDLSLLPLFIFWLGPGKLAAIAMSSLVGFFPMFFTFRDGVRSIPSELFEVASVFNSGQFLTFWKVVLPAISPHILSGLRLAYDFNWEIIIAVEIATSARGGIGSLISMTVSGGSLQVALAAVLAVAVLAIVVDRLLFARLDSNIKRWA